MELETSEWPPSLIANDREHRVALVRVAALSLGSRGLAEEAVHDAWGAPGSQGSAAFINRPTR